MDWFSFDPKVTWDTLIQLILLISGFFFVWRQLKAQHSE